MNPVRNVFEVSCNFRFPMSDTRRFPTLACNTTNILLLRSRLTLVSLYAKLIVRTIQNRLSTMHLIISWRESFFQKIMSKIIASFVWNGALQTNTQARSHRRTNMKYLLFQELPTGLPTTGSRWAESGWASGAPRRARRNSSWPRWSRYFWGEILKIQKQQQQRDDQFKYSEIGTQNTPHLSANSTRTDNGCSLDLV